MKKAIRINAEDQIATVLEDVVSGESLAIYSQDMEEIARITALQNIPFGNKIALKEIKENTVLHKGGYPIGNVIKHVELGDLVHVQNVRSSHIDIPEGIIDEIIRQMGIREDI